MSDKILCVGEILWDALPEGLFLGGAPFNVACHLQALGQEVACGSRVGDDRLGQEALRRMRARGLSTDLVQVDHSRPTGFVQVDLEAPEEPSYEILKPAAWDAITLTDSLQRHAEQADALVYGSLAQRALPSRGTIERLCAADLLRVFDVNLRPPFVDRTVVTRSLEAADVVKCNADELQRLQDWFDVPATAEDALGTLAATFECSCVCVTAGHDGAGLWMDGDVSRHSGYAVDVDDPVGAGDAFLAALLAGLLGGWSGTDLLGLANRLGAYVAARPGALPAHSADTVAGISALCLSP